MLLPALLPRCQRQTAELIEIGGGERERWGEWGGEGGIEREREGGREGVREGEREREVAVASCGVAARRGPATSPQGWIKSSFSIALMCSTTRRVPASAGTTRGAEKDDVIPLGGMVVPNCTRLVIRDLQMLSPLQLLKL